MKSLKLTLATAALMIAPFAMNAQEEAKPIDEKANHERIAEKLGLSDEQKTKMKEINAKYKPQQQALNEKIKALKEEKKALGEAQHKEMEAILTPEQAEKFKAMKLKRKETKVMNRKKMMMQHNHPHKEGEEHNHPH